MNEELRNVLLWAGIVLMLAAAYFLGRALPKVPEPCRMVRDTVTVRDTVRDTVPRPFAVRFDHWDTLYVPLYIMDSATTDSTPLPVPVPIERKEYVTKDYRAVVSGYKPRLETMDVFRRTQTITVTPKTKRWGIGPQAGFGIPGGWYVGVGVSYHLWQW